MRRESKIYVAGHMGMVGSAIVRALQAEGYDNIVLHERRLDLRSQHNTMEFFRFHEPDHVFVAAALVGGIEANMARPAEFLHDNLRIASNLVEAAHACGTTKLLMLGSSCIYPRDAPQPFLESVFLSGYPEPSNRAYAVAKICAIELCDAYRSQYGSGFISAMPCNLYGPGDRYEVHRSHVIPDLIRKFHLAKKHEKDRVELLGTGTPLREFLHVDDLARACLLLMELYDEPGPINVGTGQEVSIRDLATLVANVVGYTGRVIFAGGPDGMGRKVVDSRRIEALGWRPTIALQDGLKHAYEDFLSRA
jgi:GDP-L-fucose synthase